MKNKKGFTLIEVLAVIVILGILVIIFAPSVLNSLEAGKTGLDKINQKNIKDAAESVILEVITCKVSNETFKALNVTMPGDSRKRCTVLQNAVFDQVITTTVDKLTKNGYFKDDSHICSGTVKITTNSSDYSVSVELLEDVECRK